MYLETCFGDVTLIFSDNLCYKERGDITVIIEDKKEIEAEGKNSVKTIYFDLKDNEALFLARLLLMAVESSKAENDRMQFENPNEY